MNAYNEFATEVSKAAQWQLIKSSTPMKVVERSFVYNDDDHVTVKAKADVVYAYTYQLRYVVDGKPQLLTVNLGTGGNTTVLELVKAFEKASGKHIPYEICPRRAGDKAAYWTNPELARELLGWTAKRGIEKMCEDTWRWQQMNPEGYPD